MGLQNYKPSRRCYRRPKIFLLFILGTFTLKIKSSQPWCHLITNKSNYIPILQCSQIVILRALKPTEFTGLLWAECRVPKSTTKLVLWNEQTSANGRSPGAAGWDRPMGTARNTDTTPAPDPSPMLWLATAHGRGVLLMSSLRFVYSGFHSSF